MYLHLKIYFLLRLEKASYTQTITSEPFSYNRADTEGTRVCSFNSQSCILRATRCVEGGS